MSEIISRLRETRETKVRELRHLLESASVEGRDLNVQESEEFARANAEIDQLDARISEVKDQTSRAQLADDAFARIAGKPVTGPGSAGAPLLPSMRQYQEEIRDVW